MNHTDRRTGLTLVTDRRELTLAELSQRERELLADRLLLGQPAILKVPAEFLPPPPEPTAAQVRRSFTEPTIWSGKV